LNAVPFQFIIHPQTLKLHADQNTGVYTGDLEIGLHLKPGPTQKRSMGVQEIVYLTATGDNVLFQTSQPGPAELPPLRMELSPSYWDLATPYIYDLTTEIRLINETSLDQNILLSLNMSQEEGYPQVSAILEKTSILVKSGTIETVLLPSEVTAQKVGREIITISAVVTTSPLSLPPAKLTLSYDPLAPVNDLYQITTPNQLTVHLNTSVNLVFNTANGSPGNETWEVNDPIFLLDHGLSFTPNGQLLATAVKGPITQKTVVFRAIRQTAPRTRTYAAKAITLLVRN
jgi:hypothetical protein